ncbi:MAG TPA: PAS domain S-box protein [Bryobacteraceae bacterium]|nr:PAS domain S-box protein [Bryobacteraceae bacterium]
MFHPVIVAAGLLILTMSGAPQPQPLSTAAQVHQLPAAAAKQGLPVVLRGTVTQFIPEWAGFSLQDRTDAVWVYGNVIKALDLHAGQVVEVHGTAGPGNFAPVVQVNSVKVLGSGPLPKPRPADWKYLSSGACDNTYVSLTGVVRSAITVEPPRWRWRATAIHIDLGGNEQWVYFRDPSPFPLAQLPDSTVRVNGTCAVLANSRKRFEGVAVLVPSVPNQLQILDAAQEITAGTPLTTIDRMFLYTPGTDRRRRVKISGTVIWAEGNRAFVQEGTNGVLVRTVLPENVEPGERVYAIGFPSAGAYSAEMEDAVLVDQHRQGAVPPFAIAAGELLARFHSARPFLPDSMLVRISGTVLGVSQSINGDVISLEDGSTMFNARLLKTQMGRSGLSLASGARVAVTGVCVIQADDLGLPQSFEILMRSSQDVRILEEPSWLTRTLAVRTAGILMVLVLVTVIVVIRLTHRVGAQTTVIEQQKERERAMGQRLQDLVENANDVVYILKTDGHVLHANSGAERLTGYSREEMLRLNMTDLLAPEERSLLLENLASPGAERGTKFEQAEWNFVRKDGSHVAVELSQRFVADDDGETRVQAIGRDVSARKRALFDNEERFRTLANNISQLAWMADQTGSVVWYNERWFQYTGSTLAELGGEGWRNYLHPEHTERVVARRQQCFDTGEIWEDTFLLRGKDGQFRWFLAKAMPIHNNSGNVVRWFGTATDITEQKQIETALQRSNEDLRQFAYIASHDLQEPLRNVCIYAQMLARSFTNGDLTPERAKYIDVVTSGAKRMEALISDLLAYSRLTGTEDLEMPNVAMESVLETAMEDLRTVIEESKARIIYGDLPVVRASAAHLAQVMQNLLGNAIKYRKPDAAPEIIVRAEQQVDRWIFSVADNGRGFEPEYGENVFGIFKRLHGQEIPGTGIGLAICKTIVERHGGKIWAEGRPGVGATFWFTLPH